MTPVYKKRAYCLSCQKYLPDEFVFPHKALNHRVDFYDFGGYVNHSATLEPETEEKPLKTDLFDLADVEETNDDEI